MGDGMGDFSHLLDIVSFLKHNEQTKQHEYVLIVEFVFEEHRPYFTEKLQALEIPFFLEKTTTEIIFPESFIEFLKETDQIICISSESVFFHKKSPLYSYIKPGVIQKFIGEHERHDAFASYLQCRSLGLRPECYGLKLATLKKITGEQALNMMAQRDGSFIKDLLKVTQSDSHQTFSKTHTLIPMYFNKCLPLHRFLLLLCINKTITNEKNCVLYSSGHGTDILLHQDDMFQEGFLKQSHIKEIQIIHKEREEACKTFSINPNAHQMIYILHGYKIEDVSYQALYQQAAISGVSGDNTLEMSWSANAFTYYHSTNPNNKRMTFNSLKAIIEHKITLPEAVKRDYAFFLENLHDLNETSTRYREGKEKIEKLLAGYQLLDFNAMLESWPQVIKHLMEHYNYYHQLPAIIHNEPIKSNEMIFSETPNAELGDKKRLRF